MVYVGNPVSRIAAGMSVKFLVRMRQRATRRSLYALPVQNALPVQIHFCLVGAQSGAFVRELAVLIPVV